MNLIKKYYFARFFAGLLFTVPTWVAFQLRFLNYSQMASMEMVSTLLAILMQLPTGALADSLGRKKVVFLGFLISGLGNIFCAFSTNGTMMMIGLWIVAIGSTFVSGADVAMVYDYLKHRGKESDFASVNANGILIYRSAMILAIFAGGYLYSIHPGAPMVAKGLSFLIAGLIFMGMVELTFKDEHTKTLSFSTKIRDGIGTLFATKDSSLRSIYYVLVGGITWSIVYQYMNSLANDFGYTPETQGWLFSGIYIVTNIVMTIVAKNKNLISQKNWLIIFPAIIVIGLVPMRWLGSVTMIPFLSLLIFASGSRFSILDGWINGHLPSSHRATSLSALNMMVTMLNGLIIFSFGSTQQSLLTPSVLTIMGILSLLILTPITYKLVTIKN